MFEYNPLDANKLIEAGIYEATLVSAEDKPSKAGKPMVEIKLAVQTAGREVTLRDFLMPGSGTWKIEALAKALGQQAAFTKRRFDPAKHLGCPVVVTVTTKESEQFGPQNQVKGYSRSDKPQPVAAGHEREPGEDDDLPF